MTLRAKTDEVNELSTKSSPPIAMQSICDCGSSVSPQHCDLSLCCYGFNHVIKRIYHVPTMQRFIWSSYIHQEACESLR